MNIADEMAAEIIRVTGTEKVKAYRLVTKLVRMLQESQQTHFEKSPLREAVEREFRDELELSIQKAALKEGLEYIPARHEAVENA